MTVITAETIQRYGISSIPDALRLVPGMAITQASGDDYRINYHGSNILVPRRMNVLIDGVSVYRPALSRVDWGMLPITIEEVARIEVTRGPNSASYGANSMLAIINIITKKPSQSTGTTVSGGYGSLKTSDVTVRHSGHFSEATDYQISLNQTSTDGYDTTKGNANAILPAHDSVRMTRLTTRVITEIDPSQSLDFKATLVNGAPNFQFIDAYQTNFPDSHIQDSYVSLLWKKVLSDSHELQISAYNTKDRMVQEWRTCPPLALFLPEMYALWRANPRYATSVMAGHLPHGGTANDDSLAKAALSAIRNLGQKGMQPTCVDADQNLSQSRTDFELQDTQILSEKLRIVSGIGMRQDAIDSRTYENGYVNNRTYRAFANLEYKPADFININTGGFVEKSQLSGSLFSPRIAANIHVDEKQTFRFIVSKGSRMPDIHELVNDWAYRVTNMSVPLNGSTNGTFFQNAHGVPTLKPENILSKEIGYMLNLPEYGLLLDAKIYNDSLSDLISEKNQLSDFNPTNNNAAKLQGFELQINFDPNDRWSTFFNYSYLPTNEATTAYEQTQYSKNSGSLGVSHRFNNDWRGSVAYYFSSGDGVFQSSYGRTDLSLSKQFQFLSHKIKLSLTARHLSNTTSTYADSLAKARVSSFDSANQFYLSTIFSF